MSTRRSKGAIENPEGPGIGYVGQQRSCLPRHIHEDAVTQFCDLYIGVFADDFPQLCFDLRR